MKKFWLGFLAGIIFTIMALVTTIFVLYTKAANEIDAATKYQPQQNLTPAIELPEKGVINFQEITDDSKPIVALFYVDWCGYCRRFMPIFGQYAQKYNKDFTFALINCDNPENKKITHENNVTSFPTLKIIDKQLNYVAPVDINATSSEKIFKTEIQKHLKLREKLVK